MTIKEMKARLREINTQAAKLGDGESEKLDALLAEAKDLAAKIEEANTRGELQRLADGAADDPVEGKLGESGIDPKDSAAKRGAALKAQKVVQYKNTITSTTTVLTKHNAEDLKPTFNDVSCLVDRVRVVPLKGGESYKRGFMKGYGIGGYTAEGANYNDAEPSWGYAEMTKTKVTAYCEEPEEIAKLAPADYDGVIGSSTARAVRKFLSRQILVGEGGTGKLCGIFHNPTSAADDIIERGTDLAISEIDENTLDEIIYSFGGDEDVEDAAVLILNKLDLKAFATVVSRADGRKVYTIVHHGNTGTINGVPYIINSACGAISSVSTAKGTYCMAYGPLSNYELPVFSDMDVQRSTEYKFKQGQIAHRADIFVGGNVAAHNGFLRIKKAEASTESE